MASLQRIGSIFYVRFRFAGRPYRRSLVVGDEAEAKAAQQQVELTLHRIKTGLLPPPPPGGDVSVYIVSGGKNDGIPPVIERPVPMLQELWENYLASLPTGAKEESSLKTEKGHFKHLLRILKGRTCVVDLGTQDLQEYINRRSKEPGFRGKVKPKTIRKELSTFRNVWNNFAVPRQVVDKSFRVQFGKLQFPKDVMRPTFQTWEQIERQVSRGGLSENEVADLWDCLFLDLSRIRQVLDHVHRKPDLPAWLYPALVAAAHTGCRRGEILRSLVSDWDIEPGATSPSVQWREKKKDRNKQFTFRQVAATPLLLAVMSEWLASGKHPGGRHAFCDAHGRPITKKEAEYWFDAAMAGSIWSVLRGWHVFRHSFVSCMAMKSVDQRIIDASVGHQTEEMRKRYRHLFPHKQHEVLAAVFADRE